MIIYDFCIILSLIGMLIDLCHGNINSIIVHGVLIIMWELKNIEYRLIKVGGKNDD